MSNEIYLNTRILMLTTFLLLLVLPAAALRQDLSNPI
jgi:hypothetical protein